MHVFALERQRERQTDRQVDCVLTRQDVLVSVLVFVLRPLPFFSAVQQLALLLLQSLCQCAGGRTSALWPFRYMCNTSTL